MKKPVMEDDAEESNEPMGDFSEEMEETPETECEYCHQKVPTKGMMKMADMKVCANCGEALGVDAM